MPLNFTNVLRRKFCTNVLPKDVSLYMIKHSVVRDCCFIDYLTKELYHWEKTHASVLNLLMTNLVWKILIQKMYIDFHGQENRTCMRKILLNLIQTSKNNK